MSLTNEDIVKIWEEERHERCPEARFYLSPHDLARKIGVPAIEGKRTHATYPPSVYKMFLLPPKVKEIKATEVIAAQKQQAAFMESNYRLMQAQQAQNLSGMVYARPFVNTGTLVWSAGRSIDPNDVAEKYLSSIALQFDKEFTFLFGFCAEEVWHLIRPTVCFFVDERNREHSLDGPWIEFEDGQKEYRIHGATVNEKFITKWNEVTASEIFDLQNQEVQTRLIERYGSEKFMRDMNAKEIKRDEVGVLYSIAEEENPAPPGMLRLNWRRNMGICFVEVINSTPEPDGTYKKYILRVPPDTTTPKAGVAWTFGLTEKQYQPQVET